MMGALKNHRDERVSVSVEELVPQDYFLRAIEATNSFDFIEEELRPYYCENNGRSSIHPIVLFKMMFIGYFYDIRSERQLEKEIKTNIAYHWFLGFSLSDTTPDHSTISWNRLTRFIHTNIFEEIFDEIVRQAPEHRAGGGGRTLMTDSTHIKANANKNKFVHKYQKKKEKFYIDELEAAVIEDRAVDSEGNTIDFYLSSKRNAKAAKRFLKKALASCHATKPRTITADGDKAYPVAIRKLKEDNGLPPNTPLRVKKYVNNIMEQDHQFIKKRIRNMLGLKSYKTARKMIDGIEAMYMIKKRTNFLRGEVCPKANKANQSSIWLIFLYICTRTFSSRWLLLSFFFKLSGCIRSSYNHHTLGA